MERLLNYWKQDWALLRVSRGWWRQRVGLTGELTQSPNLDRGDFRLPPPGQHQHPPLQEVPLLLLSLVRKEEQSKRHLGRTLHSPTPLGKKNALETPYPHLPQSEVHHPLMIPSLEVVLDQKFMRAI
ncbi:TPA_inf: C protein [La Piedad Michoacan Mexico virus]|uniref:C protein n=3 Tax=La Piedad-Michoacan-Mexico virus TaxID=3052562 RepID=A7E3E9_LPMV